MELIHTFEFSAAHQLPKVPEGHKCGRMHGHTYKVEIYLRGVVNPDDGWLVDFGDVKNVWQRRVHSMVDHRTLNDLEGLENPTAETLAPWIYTRLKPPLPDLYRVVVWETPHSAAAYDILERL